MRDCIHLKGLEFYGYHGLWPEESVLGQKFIIDLDLYLEGREAGLTDDLQWTVNYVDLIKRVKEIVEKEPCKLLEALAERIASVILTAFACSGVRVEVHKPHAPISEIFQDISVEIYRESV